MDVHFEAIPGLGTFTTRCLAGGDFERLCRETNGSLGANLAFDGTVDKFTADLFEIVDIAGRQGDTDKTFAGFGRLKARFRVLGDISGSHCNWLLECRLVVFRERCSKKCYGKACPAVTKVKGNITDGASLPIFPPVHQSGQDGPKSTKDALQDFSCGNLWEQETAN